MENDKQQRECIIDVIMHLIRRGKIYPSTTNKEVYEIVDKEIKAMEAKIKEVV